MDGGGAAVAAVAAAVAGCVLRRSFPGRRQVTYVRTRTNVFLGRCQEGYLERFSWFGTPAFTMF